MENTHFLDTKILSINLYIYTKTRSGYLFTGVGLMRAGKFVFRIT